MLRVGYRLFYYKKLTCLLLVCTSVTGCTKNGYPTHYLQACYKWATLSYEALVFTGLINYVGIIAKFFK